jgi:hypothetical protein
MSTPAERPPIRRAMTLLALMTIAAFGGPVGIGAVLRGGKSPKWPPDRPVEWATLFGVSGLVLALMVLSIAVSVANQRALARRRATAPRPPSSTDVS